MFTGESYQNEFHHYSAGNTICCKQCFYIQYIFVMAIEIELKLLLTCPVLFPWVCKRTSFPLLYSLFYAVKNFITFTMISMRKLP